VINEWKRHCHKLLAHAFIWSHIVVHELVEQLKLPQQPGMGGSKLADEEVYQLKNK